MKKLIGWCAAVAVVAGLAAYAAAQGKSAPGSVLQAPKPMVVRSCTEPKPKPGVRPSKRGAMAGAIPPPIPMAAPAGAAMKTSQPEAATPAKREGGGKPDVHAAAKKVPKDVQKASAIYLSNDDSMSLASAQRIFYAIDNFLTLYREEVRPHELLNYYHFTTEPVAEGKLFSVKADALPKDGATTLSFAVQGKTLTKASRRPAVITLIVDRSGSMHDKGKMEYLKAGLTSLKGQLKSGDVVNMTWFDHEVCTPIESMAVGRDGTKAYDRALANLAPRGSTDLHAGLVEGYKLAEKSYDPARMNRVIVITDAIANTGELSPELMGAIGTYYDTKRIALSGVGVGQDFNDELLDEITERGRGAYLFLGSEEATKRVFGSDFLSLLETVARDVHFKVVLPKSLRMRQFYGEEVSAEKAKVQPINYFANTSQLFLMDMKGEPAGEDEVGFEIEYTLPDGNAEQTQRESFPASAMAAGERANIRKARIIMAFADVLAQTAETGPKPCRSFCFVPFKKSDVDSEKGKKLCAEAQAKMKAMAADFSDADVADVLDRTAKYCSRF